jgi:hypothetical protein
LTRRRPRLDAFELAVLSALFALSVAILAGLVVRTLTKGGVITGSDGFLVVDQMQYLGWLRQAGEHVLIENLYDLEDGDRTFLHPGLLVSGAANRLGLGLMASYAIWKPIAVVALFAAVRQWTRRFLDRRDDRRLALLLCLFAASPVAAFVGWTKLATGFNKYQLDFLGNEMWPGTWLWGYMFTAVAVAMIPLALLAYERGRGEGRRSMLLWAAGAALICSWFQPWQGATLVLTLAGAEALARRRARRPPLASVRDLAAPLAAAIAPLVYYLVLSRVDPAWELAGTANDDFPLWPWWLIAMALAPFAPAVLAYRLPAPAFGDLALRLWPFAALVVYLQPAGTFPFHAFQGLAIPLVTLGVLGVRAMLLRERPLPVVPAVVVAALFILPGTAYNADHMLDAINKGFQAHFMEPGEHDALRHLDAEPEPGGVLAPAYLGTAIPAYAGREIWVGAGSWTPDFTERNEIANDLFDGRLGPAASEALVRRTGARFLFSDCHGRPDLTRRFAAFTEPPRRFGCATVWRVRP